MRQTTRATLDHYLSALDLRGDVLEVGAFTLKKSAINAFPPPRFKYHGCDLVVGDVPNTIRADITDCRSEIPDESFDVVFSADVFEHIDRPWQAAAEIGRILRPGGIVVTRTVWAWRNHPCPIDYWRFSAECLATLFEPLECLEAGYDLSERRDDYSGFWANGRDSVPVDEFGGFRENWAVYSVHRKGAGPAVAQFKRSDHALATHLRRDTQGVVTNPTMLGAAHRPDPFAVAQRLGDMDQRLGGIDRRMSEIVASLECTTRPRRTIPARAVVAAIAFLAASTRSRARRVGHRHPADP